jgi:hypothetical protein
LIVRYSRGNTRNDPGDAPIASFRVSVGCPTAGPVRLFYASSYVREYVCYFVCAYLVAGPAGWCCSLRRDKSAGFPSRRSTFLCSNRLASQTRRSTSRSFRLPWQYGRRILAYQNRFWRVCCGPVRLVPSVCGSPVAHSPSCSPHIGCNIHAPSLSQTSRLDCSSCGTGMLAHDLRNTWDCRVQKDSQACSAPKIFGTDAPLELRRPMYQPQVIVSSVQNTFKKQGTIVQVRVQHTPRVGQAAPQYAAQASCHVSHRRVQSSCSYDSHWS